MKRNLLTALLTLFALSLSAQDTLNRKTIELKKVSVFSKTPLIERKTDRVIFNVENSISAIGGDGIDALSKAPGLRVNDNGISIAGKSQVKVMVNDRLIQLSGTDLINYVRSIPSATIKRIEIITNPSSRYEADGNSGLINIILKKNTVPGFNGMINTGVIIASRYTTGMTGILNYNLSRLHLSTNLSGAYGKMESKELSSFSGPATLWERQGISLTRVNALRGDIKADYDITTNTTAGIKYMEGTRAYHINLNDEGRFFQLPLHRLDSVLRNNGLEQTQYNLRNAEFYIDHKLDTTGKKIEFSSNYLRYGTADDNVFQNNSYTAAEQLLNQYQIAGTNDNDRVDIFTQKLDISLPYPFAEIEFGAKLSSISSRNQLDYRNETLESIYHNNDFHYRENTQSIYGSVSKDFHLWNLKLGLRMESTQTRAFSSEELQSQENKYTVLFPTLYLKRTLDTRHVFSFSYGRRINRPDYSLLNPVRIYSAVNVYEDGNPLLKPSFSNNFEINYNYADWLNTSVYTNIVSNGFSTLNFYNPVTSVQSALPGNYANTVTSGLSETLTINRITWWESNNQFNMYLNRSGSTGALAGGTLKKISGYISTDNTLTLNTSKTLVANATFWYQFPEVANRLISASYHAADISIRALFLQRKLTLALNATDIFKTSTQQYSGTINGVYQQSLSYRDNRKARLTVVYRFGNSKGNKAARPEDNAETNRIKQGQ